ncbi:MAG: ribosome biogenesis GTPase Der [Wenzhouxiangellaceae bacterium]|nr:ribosome biogenesis GTPase Der [Wenzhouxiangellaceae bacterium]
MSAGTPTGLPVVVIAGRPNVGKSTLFNALTRTRDALVADQPGVTRDRIYGRASLAGRETILVDTGGLASDVDALAAQAGRQTWVALAEADVVAFVIDGRAALNADDYALAARIRRLDRPVVLVVNKTDGIDIDRALAEAAELGLGDILAISAAHRRGLDRLAQTLAEHLPPVDPDAAAPPSADTIRLALIGRPNVGKSTLLNRLLGETRSIAADLPGTTRDPVSADLERDGRQYRLVDTAGMRRRGRNIAGIESLSTLKAMQAMQASDVTCLLLDAEEGVTEQDARLAGHVAEAGRGLVIALNKWDGVDQAARTRCLEQAGERLGFITWAPVVLLSALHGSGLGELFDAIETVHDAACASPSSGMLNRILERATAQHAPPVVRRFAAKLKYAHPGGNFPTRIIIHGNHTDSVPESYRRYLVNRFRAELELVGVPLKLVFRDSDNPYAGKRNRLTPRQIKRRQRVRGRQRR